MFEKSSWCGSGLYKDRYETVATVIEFKQSPFLIELHRVVMETVEEGKTQIAFE